METVTGVTARTCARCPADISARRPSARYCVACAYNRHREAQREARRTKRAPRLKRTCASCPTDITHRAAHARYCAPCAEDRDRAQRREAAERHDERRRGLEAQARKLVAEVKLGTLAAPRERAVAWLLTEAMAVERRRCQEIARGVADAEGSAWDVLRELRR